ncbi:response regulator [Rufibacter glacialis]|uniref:Response regulator n=1 Tax=Rufibacter glacialis TaxID=1259555 RepID=A0A5M8QMB8_9BACT|nr:response regulator [Rufibacter glacialis]KAA6435372.1 response regulator [Rufibacter glacialis]GGK62812.1 response regulator [Rufibacter glacialis]
MKKLRGILLIDDDDTNNFLNHRLLNRMQITDRIKEFRNGKQAFDYLYNISEGHVDLSNPEYFKPSLILLDINMPVMDGFEFLALFEKLDAKFLEDVVLALLTTSEHGQDTERAAASGIPYLIKPLTAEKVQELLERHVPETEG